MAKKTNKCLHFSQKKWQWVLAKKGIGAIIGARSAKAGRFENKNDGGVPLGGEYFWKIT